MLYIQHNNKSVTLSYIILQGIAIQMNLSVTVDSVSVMSLCVME